VSLRQEIRSIQRELGITTIFVTTTGRSTVDSDRIVVMNAGNVEQSAPVRDLQPSGDALCRTFVGTLNTLDAKVLDTTAQNRFGRRQVVYARQAPAAPSTTLPCR